MAWPREAQEREAGMDEHHEAWLARTRAAWDERAPRWDAMASEVTATPERVADVQRTIAALRLTPGAQLLDAGCGSGQFAVAFAALGVRVTAIDLAPEMIARARQHGEGAGGAVEWRTGDLTLLGDADATYDAIHARVSLQFVPDLSAALRELRRVLRPGGRCFASVPGALSPIYRESWRRHLRAEPEWVNFVLPWELEALLTDMGWTIHDGWGDFGSSLSGETSGLTQAEVAGLDRRLQQAAATTWATIASPDLRETPGLAR
jgi:2-polyprenyl-3-methyl-5-hydroxy-6-metoxy-1,4-benzoquinol methylase